LASGLAFDPDDDVHLDWNFSCFLLIACAGFSSFLEEHTVTQAQLSVFPSQPTTHVTRRLSVSMIEFSIVIFPRFFFFSVYDYSRARYVALFLDINKVQISLLVHELHYHSK